jgi:hypothetical protein
LREYGSDVVGIQGLAAQGLLSRDRIHQLITQVGELPNCSLVLAAA